MNKPNLIWIFILVVMVGIGSYGVYIRMQPTEFIIICDDYDSNYYTCRVSSPLPFSSDFGFNAVNLCLKDKPNSLQGINNCANSVWSKTNCKDITNVLTQLEERYIIQSIGYCKSLRAVDE